MSWPRRLLVAAISFRDVSHGRIQHAGHWQPDQCHVVHLGAADGRRCRAVLDGGGFKVSTSGGPCVAQLVDVSGHHTRARRSPYAARTGGRQGNCDGLAIRRGVDCRADDSAGVGAIAEHRMPSHKGFSWTRLFEVVSALGTVGLSVGMTPHLTLAGRLNHYRDDVYRPPRADYRFCRLVTRLA